MDSRSVKYHRPFFNSECTQNVNEFSVGPIHGPSCRKRKVTLGGWILCESDSRSVLSKNKVTLGELILRRINEFSVSQIHVEKLGYPLLMGVM